MTTRFHGITSISLVGIAVVLAAVGLFRVSWVTGVIYLAGCLAAMPAILYAFCARCPCRERCGHVFPGRLAMALTNRRPGPYRASELVIVAVALLWLLGLPQVWLWRSLGLLAAFWLLSLVAVVQIRAVVCPQCANVYCPLRARG